MNRRRLRYSAVGAIVVASVAAPLVIQHRARVQWREQEALLREQAGEFAALLAENKRLSNLVVQTMSSFLTSDQFRELLRLRSEIGQLRRDASEMARLQAAHLQLLAAAGSPGTEPDSALPDPRTVLAYWPKAQLTSAGYADPASALQTALSAMSRNDPTALAASVTPEARAELIDGALITALWVLGRDDPAALAGSVAPEIKYRALMEDVSPAERMAFQARGATDILGPSSGFYVVGQKLSQDQAILEVYFEGEDTTREFALKKIEDEWKVEGIYPAGRNDDEPRRGPRLWP